MKHECNAAPAFLDEDEYKKAALGTKTLAHRHVPLRIELGLQIDRQERPLPQE